MTRQVDPKVKDNIHVRARSETERRIISELKQLALQDQVELADLIFEGIDLMFKTHHWPPGNPQLQLTIFQNETPQVKSKYGICNCGQIPEVRYRSNLDRKNYNICKQCFKTLRSREIESWSDLPKEKKP